MLGGIETLSELCLALALSGYGRLLALFISDKAPMKLPGAPFVLASAILVVAFAILQGTFTTFAQRAAAFF